jgi:hypothetical protein
MTSKIIPVLIDEDNPKLDTILERIAEAIGNATKSDLSILTKLQRDKIKKACDKLSVSCHFGKFRPGYLIHARNNPFAIFYSEDTYCSSSDCDFDGNDRSSYSTRAIDSVACLTNASEVFGVIVGVYSEDIFPKKAVRRIEQAERFKDRLELIAYNQENDRIVNALDRLPTRYDQFTPFSDYAGFVYSDVERELPKIQERLRQDRTRKTKGIQVAKNLIARL